ncbi:MAG: SEC-C domain-containing protein [Patescibacteria group bacterium]|jgi:hypothetical protein
MTTIPLLNDPELIKLIQLMDSSLKPISVPVEPEKYAEESECLPAVKEKIEKDGGSQILGWQVWKSDFWIEAEFHSVWKSPEGKLIDITPKLIFVLPNFSIPVSLITFLPDSKIKYIGAQIDNIRLNITNNEVVDDIIEIFKSEFKLLNRGERALEYTVELKDEDADLLREIKIIQLNLYSMIQRGMNRESDCFCGSNNKYKDCCYQKIIQISKL